jgi:hypothetical protein
MSPYSSTNAPDATPRPPTVEDALILARFGFPIIPLAPGTKHPPKGFDGWQQRATTDPATIRAWWREWPDANVGVFARTLESVH